MEPSLDPDQSDVPTIRVDLEPPVRATLPAAKPPASEGALPDPSLIELPGAVETAPASTAAALARAAPTLEPLRREIDPIPPVVPQELQTAAARAEAFNTVFVEPVTPSPPVVDPEPVGPLFRPPVEPVLELSLMPEDDENDMTRVVPAPAPISAAFVPVLTSIPAAARPLPELRPPSRRAAALSRFDARLQTANRFLDRYPWLMPTVSFSVGWISFFLFQRGEGLARGIAVIALLGWPWLFAENLIGRWVVARSNGRLSISAVRFVTQQIQQEILFFALPFLFGAMVLEPGQMLFVGVAAIVAILVSLDPIYLHRIAPHAGLSSALHAYCTLIAALVVLPVALHLPLDQALPLSLAITAGSLVLSLPRMLIAAPNNKMRLLGVAALAAAFPLMWASRAAIPPAGLWVREARITDRIEGLEPGYPIKVFGTGALQLSGGIAFVAVRAPTGLSQAVVFDWHREGELVDRIPAQISGGREGGFRTYSRKQNFPEDSRGNWRVDLRTPQGQLIARMRFEVN
ncbi:DUF5924 family protein [Panacagrimonas perspica]|uniref:DUF5924 family protein n=1 Tax=Panacagrimonas perspica TaxID=381431 RepID=UPI0013C2D8A9|nr:DUF2914 domain-containing protein [Panacagrimonas perspica]